MAIFYSRSDWSDLKTLVERFLLPYWKLTALLVLMSFLAATLTSVYPLLLAPVLNIGQPEAMQPATSLSELSLNNLGSSLLALLLHAPGAIQPWQLVAASVALFLIVGSLAAGIGFLAHMVSSLITTRAFRDLQIELHRHLFGQELSFFLHSSNGELTSRFVIDAGETMSSLDLAIRQGLQSLLQVVIYGWLLVKTSPLLALATLAISLLHLIVNRFVGARLRRSTAEKLDTLGSISGALQEGFTSIRVIKSFGAERHEHNRFSVLARLVERVSVEYSRHKHGETPLRLIADSVALGLMLLLAFVVWQAGDMTFQGFVLFMVVVRLTIAPISAFAQSMTRLQGGLGSARRVLELLERQPAFRDGQRTDPEFRQQIRLTGVDFAYAADQPVLKGIDLELRKGELLAVVGASGAGKSTLIDIILRLYDPVTGQIQLDGVDIRDFRQSDYRRLFGVVSQESLLFNDTIGNNIIFGRDTGEPDDLRRAAEIANALDFIQKMPDGFDTVVGDRGVRLSGGQRQRIAIARAIYARPPILVLDEATSALDSESERSVQQAIDRVLSDATAIVIAHRLSTILHADRIVVLDNGTISAVGKHAELLVNSPIYRRLCEMQFRDLDMERQSKTQVGVP